MGNERNDPETNGTNNERRASKSNGTASEDFVDDDKVGDITWSSTGDESDDGMPLETMSPSVMCERPLEETDLVASKTHVPRTPSITSSPRPLGKLATITTNGPTSYSSSAPTDAPPVRQPLGKLNTLTVNDSAAIISTTTENNHARHQGHNHNEQPMTTEQQPSTANPFIQDMLNRQTSSAAFIQQLHETSPSPSPIPSPEGPSPSSQGRPARPPSQPGAFPSTFSETFSEDEFDLHNRDEGTGNDNVSNPFRDHQPHRPSTSGLVEATPVSQQLTIHGSARPVDLEAQTTTMLATKEKRDQETNKLIALVGLCIVVLVMVGVAIHVSAGGRNTDLVIVPVTNTSNSTGSMESPVTSTDGTTLPSGLKLDLPMQLPEATLHTIRQDVDGITPQYKAYRWMQQDPYLRNYLHDEPRLIQRYVAVTFYYATQGETWDEQGGGTVTVFTDGTGNPLQRPPNSNDNGRLLQGNSGNGNGNNGGGGGNNRQQGSSNGGSGSGGSGGSGNNRQQGGSGGNSNGSSNGGGGGGSSGGNRPPRPDNLPSPSEDMHVNITSEQWLSYNTSECSWYSTAGFRPFQEACDENHTLTFLGVMQNNLQGQLPQELALLTDLEELQFGRNKVGGPIISQIGALTNLNRLHLFSNKHTGTVPSEIGLLSNNLVKVGLFNNQLTGSLPPEFFQLKYVTDIRMSTNRLSGTLPSDMGLTMHKLQILQITRNEFSGAIPRSLGLLTGLKEIVLHDNRFSSSIPTELGQARRLEKLFARNNLLSGPIPSELGLLEELETINLEGNAALSGTLPTELAFLNGTLRSMRLEGTSISGTIPHGLCSLRSLSFDCLPPTLCGCDCACNATES